MKGGSVISIASDPQATALFWCPGCEEPHGIPTKGPNAWRFNGSVDMPTFDPSIKVTGTQRITDDQHRRIMAGEKIEPAPLVCHSYVRNGKIEFQGDCTHRLAGKTVDLTPAE
jgi:hypothetical protein